LMVAEIGGGTRSGSGNGLGLDFTRVAHVVVVGELLPRFQKKVFQFLPKIQSKLKKKVFFYPQFPSSPLVSLNSFLIFKA
jgi:hypothetical protein